MWNADTALSRAVVSNSTRLRVAATLHAHRASVIVTVALFISTFLVTRQIQVPVLNGTAAPWALLVVAACLRWHPTLRWLTPIVVYGAFSAFASIVVGNDAGNAVRFLFITMGTLLAFHIRPTTISTPTALLPLVFQSALLIGISLWLAFSQDLELASSVRTYILDTTWGDVYSFDGIYYRVQLIGNALVPLLFLISVWRFNRGRFYRFTTIFSLMGVIAAGNLTYLLAAAVAIGIRCWRLAISSTFGQVITVLLVCIGIAFGWNATNEMMQRKFEGSDSSMGVRFDQIDAAVNLWSDSPGSFVFGTGLGSGFPDGRERNYSEFQYIELQSLYLFVQLGLIGMLLYLATLVVNVRHLLDPDGRRIFWLYMLSGCTNPTILDTNQIIATMLLVCLFPRGSSTRS